jgi:NTP pyrophosphatase (non-canonical NTP hydrolase)
MKELQETVHAAAARYGLSRDPAVRALDAASELGELAKEILRATGYGARPLTAGDGLREELGDCLFALLNLADVLGLDAADALCGALGKYEARFRARGEISSGR